MYRVAIFISHSWKYSHHYDTLSSWIFSGSWNVGGISLEFSDTSVPKDNPIHNAPNSGALESANIDLTEELVSLISAQRNFQANAQAIETANNMTQTIVNLQV